MPSQDLQKKLETGYTSAAHKSITELITSEYEKPTIGIIAKANPVELLAFLLQVIGSEISFWKVGKDAFSNDGQKQAAETIKLIIEAYPHLKVSDIRMVFKMAKLGDFGVTFDRMDGATILEWFKKYDKLRLDEELRIKENNELRLKSDSGVEIKTLLELPVSSTDPEILKELEETKKRVLEKLSKVEVLYKVGTPEEIELARIRSEEKRQWDQNNRSKIEQEKKRQHDQLTRISEKNRKETN